MTQDEIIRMAREAGLTQYGFLPDIMERFERFAALVEQAKDKEIAAKQAEIDRLMWEYCPQEMTLEQVSNWYESQGVEP